MTLHMHMQLALTSCDDALSRGLNSLMLSNSLVLNSYKIQLIWLGTLS